MKHSIRINGEVKEIDCELGSSWFDKNGREIFEGDIVKFVGGEDETDAGKVVFHHGEFWVDDDLDLSTLLYGYEVTVID